MSLVASHHNRDLTVLEQLSVGSDALGTSVVQGDSPVRGAVVLPTCNRFEVYLEVDDVQSGRAAVIDALERTSSLDRSAIEQALATYEGDDAVHHLLSVATGLESMVVGEREISGQVRRAHIDAQASHHVSPLLDRLFQSALRTSRVVASSTGLGTSGRSVVSVAFDLASSTVDWPRAKALLIGTGALAETGVGSLLTRGVDIVGVYSPSGRGDEFGARHGLRSLDIDGLKAALADVDMVLACSGGESIVLTPAMVSAARAESSRPVTLVDLALHRDVAPGVAELRGVHVINLESVGAQAPGESVTSIDAARSIVAHAVARFGDGESARALDPAVVALREHVFGILEKELGRVKPGPGASEETVAQADAVEQSLRRFARTLLHTPTVRAREHAQAGQADRYLGAIRALYGIDVDMPVDACPADEIEFSDESASSLEHNA
ncbi:glutamyl-tRNA reductase [Demequina sp. B12]|uniref:glutamyl-tRNA reductase n=1 Tax=Demequina sp. B12 TaxID=2992757 RepID=UPI00237A9EA3|nr:glutamyl-tRNA reductase [Demequina sp. B12]MDE0573800.1 glutamyl-tRNA reductase [Demequina sp. B12]